jgi:uncharacterized protein (TIGR02594 family)
VATQRDVNLVIRARDEASKAFEQASRALESLLGVNKRVGSSADDAGSRLAAFTGAFLNFDKAATQVFGAADRAAAGMAKLGNSLDQRRGELASLEAQAANAARAIQNLNSVDAVVAAGRDQGPRLAQLQAAVAEYDRLGAAQRKLRTEISGLEATQQGQLSTMQQLGSTAIAASEARERLSTQIEHETRAMREQAQAANVLNSANRSTGVTRDRGDYDNLVDQIRKAASAEEQRLNTLRQTEQTEAEIARWKEAQSRSANLLPGNTATGNSARQSAAVFQDADAANAQRLERAFKEVAEGAALLDRAVGELRNKLDPLARIEANLATQQGKVNAMFRAGRISAAEYETALELLTAEAARARDAVNGQRGIDSKGRPSLFGLTPYALTNLSYQINDVVTQLASGTSLSQTMAQQAGQLIQIFPRVGSALVSAFSSPLLLAAAAGFAAIAVGVGEVNRQAEALRAFEGLLRLSADGAQYQATALAGAAQELDHFGMTAEAAVSVVRTLLNEGVNPERIVEFGQAAQNMADVLGIEATDAAKQLAEGLTGGYTEIVRLNEATNALRATELERIRVLFDQGRADEARRLAAERTNTVLEEAARKARGPWAEATLSLNSAWSGFKETLADTGPIRGMTGALDDLGKAALRAINNLNGVREIGDLDNQIRQLEDRLRRREEAFGQNPGDAMLRQGRERLAQLRQERALLASRAQVRDQDTRATDNAARTARDSASLAEIELQRRREGLERLQGQARINEAGEIALLEARRRGESEVVAQARRNLEIARQRVSVARQETQERQRQARLAETAARERLRDLVADTQDNGRENLVATAERYRGQHERSNRASLMEFMRANGVQIDPAQLAWCAAFLNAILAANGLPMQREANGAPTVQARDFLSYGNAVSNPEVGDIVVLARGGRGSGLGHVGLFQGFDAQGRVLVLGGNTSNKVGVSAENRDDVLGFRRAPNLGEVAVQQEREDNSRAERQTRFNEQIDDENLRREDSVRHARDLLGLSSDQLLNVRREHAIETAIAQAEQKALRDQLELTEDRRIEIEATVGAEFDLANAQEAATNGVREAEQERAAILERLKLAYEQGADPRILEHLQSRLDGVNESLLLAIDREIEFRERWNTPEARTAITNLMNMRATLDRDPLTIRREALQRPIDTATEQRDTLQERIQFHEGRGEFQAAEQLETQLAAVNVQLNAAITSLDAFWAAVAADPVQMAALGVTAQQVANIRFQLQATRPVAEDLSRQFLMTARQMNEAITQGLVSAVDRFAQAVGEGKNVIGSLFDTFRQFAANFLQQIAQMILSQVAFNIVSGAMAGGKGGAGKGVMGFIGGLFHQGGVVGESGQTRLVRPEWFDNATRYHVGGIAGLRAGEIPAILKRGEEVLTEADPRHVANGGRSGGPDNVKIVNAFNSDEMLQHALSSSVGERVMMNFVAKNAAVFRANLKI